jgi:hypothetical protein
MHWLTRSAVAFAAMAAFHVWYYPNGWNKLWNAAYESFFRGSIPMPDKWHATAAAVFALLPVLLIGVLAYGLAGRPFSRRYNDEETRCRKCGYNLRGISEPRCPECGEPI